MEEDSDGSRSELMEAEIPDSDESELESGNNGIDKAALIIKLAQSQSKLKMMQEQMKVMLANINIQSREVDELSKLCEEEDFQDVRRKTKMRSPTLERSPPSKRMATRGTASVDINNSFRVLSEENFPSLQPSKSQLTPAQTARTQDKARENRLKHIPLTQNEKGLFVLDSSKQANLPATNKEVIPKQRPPPPIVVRGRLHLAEVRTLVAANHIKVRAYDDKPGGLKVFTETPDDFRKLRDILKDSELSFHLFQLQDEKELKIVIRGIPQDITIEEVEEDLKRQGFVFSSVTRMRRGTKLYPMMMLNAPKSEDGRRCFDIKHVLQLRVNVEPKRKPTGGVQCFKCQRYGHVSYRCFGEVRCAFCLNNHPAGECTQPRGPGLPAKCVNCQGDHPAFASSCKNHPTQIAAKRAENARRKVTESILREGTSYAKATESAPPSIEGMSPEIVRLIQKTVEEAIKKLLPNILTNGK